MPKKVSRPQKQKGSKFPIQQAFISPELRCGHKTTRGCKPATPLASSPKLVLVQFHDLEPAVIGAKARTVKRRSPFIYW